MIDGGLWSSLDFKSPATWVPATLAGLFALYMLVQKIRTDFRTERRDNLNLQRDDDFAARAAESAAKILQMSTTHSVAMTERVDALEKWRDEMQQNYNRVVSERNDLLRERDQLRHRIALLEADVQNAQVRLTEQSNSILELRKQLAATTTELAEAERKLRELNKGLTDAP